MYLALNPKIPSLTSSCCSLFGRYGSCPISDRGSYSKTQK